eukprot:94851_1
MEFEPPKKKQKVNGSFWGNAKFKMKVQSAKEKNRNQNKQVAKQFKIFGYLGSSNLLTRSFVIRSNVNEKKFAILSFKGQNSDLLTYPEFKDSLDSIKNESVIQLDIEAVGVSGPKKRPNQTATMEVFLCENTVLNITNISNNSLADDEKDDNMKNVFNLFSIEKFENDFKVKDKECITFVGFLVNYQKVKNIWIMLFHSVSKEGEQERAVTVSSRVDPANFCSVYQFHLLLNVKVSYDKKSRRHYLWLDQYCSHIMTLASTRFYKSLELFDTSLLTKTGLLNPLSYCAASWKARVEINNLKECEKGAPKGRQNRMLRLKIGKVKSISNDSIGPHCKYSNMKIKDINNELCPAKHLISDCHKHDINYASNVLIEDSEGNVQAMRPHRTFIEECYGLKKDDVIAECEEQADGENMNLSAMVQIWFELKYDEMNEVSIDFYISDDVGQNHRRYFIAQVHRDIIDPPTFKQPYMKKKKK